MQKESDFYIPIKKHFQNKGFEVKSEINDCDCVCIKDDLIVICEFKLKFNISLVYQGMDRQKITDYVYLCVPKYKGRVSYRNFLKSKNLCKRLGLGLIIVDGKNCLEVLEPICLNNNINKKKKDSLLKEYNGRTFDLNTGGQTGTRINTAFREKNIKILCILEKDNQTSNVELIKQYGFDESIKGVLYRNVLGYFEKGEKRGYYKMSKIGKSALDDKANMKLVTFFRENIKNIDSLN